MPLQKVGSGEGTSSLAKKNGFFWKTIWNHPENSELRQKRKDHNVLHQDDDIFIPDKELKTVSKSTDAEHTFKRKGEPCQIKLQLFSNQDTPRANEAYTLDVEGSLIDGKTDGEGILKHFIPGEAKSARLILRGGEEIIPIQIGYLDPIDTIIGVQQRLNNMGFVCPFSDELDEGTQQALRKFQAENDMEETGEIDEATKSKLKSISK